MCLFVRETIHFLIRRSTRRSSYPHPQPPPPPQVRWLVTEADLYKPGAASAGLPAAAGDGSGGGGGLTGTERLLYAPEDVGTRLKVWWGKDRVFYSGTVTAWDGCVSLAVERVWMGV